MKTSMELDGKRLPEDEKISEETERYMAMWTSHIDQLLKLGFYCNGEEFEDLRKTVEKLKRLAFKCESRSRDNTLQINLTERVG
jgi:hypothetical protein